MKYLEKDLHKEAAILFEYIVSGSRDKITMPNDWFILYEKAVHANSVDKKLNTLVLKHPFLLGPADTWSSFFGKKSLLRKKLYVAAALFECLPSSAKWLLPKKLSLFHVFIYLLSDGLVILKNAILGIFCHILPGFFSLYAEE